MKLIDKILGRNVKGYEATLDGNSNMIVKSIGDYQITEVQRERTYDVLCSQLRQGKKPFVRVRSW